MIDVSEGGKAQACWSFTVSPSRQAGLLACAEEQQSPPHGPWRTRQRITLGARSTAADTGRGALVPWALGLVMLRKDA